MKNKFNGPGQVTENGTIVWERGATALAPTLVLSHRQRVALRLEHKNPNLERATAVAAALLVNPGGTVREITRAVRQTGLLCKRTMVGRDMRVLRILSPSPTEKK